MRRQGDEGMRGMRGQKDGGAGDRKRCGVYAKAGREFHPPFR